MYETFATYHVARLESTTLCRVIHVAGRAAFEDIISLLTIMRLGFLCIFIVGVMLVLVGTGFLRYSVNTWVNFSR